MVFTTTIIKVIPMNSTYNIIRHTKWLHDTIINILFSRPFSNILRCVVFFTHILTKCFTLICVENFQNYFPVKFVFSLFFVFQLTVYGLGLIDCRFVWVLEIFQRLKSQTVLVEYVPLTLHTNANRSRRINVILSPITFIRFEIYFKTHRHTRIHTYILSKILFCRKRIVICALKRQCRLK